MVEKQWLFLQLLSDLIQWAKANDLVLTGGELYRTPEQAALNASKGIGITTSLHTQRLAIDLNLFINGTYQSDSEAYRSLGEFWKTLNPLCRWGGDFNNKKDGNHFSLEDNGIK